MAFSGELPYPYKIDWVACEKFWKEPLRGNNNSLSRPKMYHKGYLQSGLSSPIEIPFWVIDRKTNVFENILVVIHQEICENVEP